MNEIRYMYPSTKTALMPPSTSVKPSVLWRCSALPSSSGSPKKIAKEKTMENASVAAIAPRPISTFSARAFTLADQIIADVPRWSISASPTTPRTSGSRKNADLYIRLCSSSWRIAMPPSGRLAATAHPCGPRIRTPSMTAWPP